jgi:hypothetical protein
MVPEVVSAVVEANGSVFAPVAVEVMAPLRARVLRYEAPETESAVEDAYGSVFAPVALETIEPVTAKPASVPKRAVVAERFVDDAVVAKNVVEVACCSEVLPVAVMVPAASEPMVAEFEKRFVEEAVVEKKAVEVANVMLPKTAASFVVEALRAVKLVDEAVVAKKVVEVELPSVVLCVSWYATEVVEWPRPADAKKDAEVVENAAPWFWERKYAFEVVENERPTDARYWAEVVEKA